MRPSEGSKPAQEFFGSLESLRGIAAFLVVVYHIPPWFRPIYDVQLVRHSYLLVNFFFVLSGFVLFHTYVGRLRNAASLLRFAVQRLGRLYPIHIIFMTPFVLIELAKGVNALRHQGDAAALAQLGRSVVANLFLVQGLGFATYEPSLNYPSWSISTEYYTYLLFGVAMVSLPRRGFALTAGLIASTTVAALLIFGPTLQPFANLLHCISGFFLGCLVRRALDSYRGVRLPFDLPVVLFVGASLALAAPWNHRSDGGAWQEQLSLPISALLIFTLLSTKSALNSLLMLRPLRWLGEISYSLYMSHALVLWCARQAFRVVLHQPDAVPQGSGSQLSALGAAVVYPLVIAATLWVGTITYRTLEAPLRDAAKRRLAGWMTVRSPG